ncbi:hypothetical protein H5410_003739 [Solanum commersonii]|uniref:Uncharacterized protein n=1 Tax=Solanum commersonii TaxID=4109 RepID=A0A9J6B5L5_SOLCO|nr:hypothetical protein H5410_003739 [Solanum commersonii]
MYSASMRRMSVEEDGVTSISLALSRGTSAHRHNSMNKTENGSLSTPVCRVGETDESITPYTEVLVSPEINPGEILPCSPTLVLSDKDSQNFDAQYGIQHTSSGRRIGGYPKSASLRRDTQPTLLEQENRSPKRVPHGIQLVFDQTPKTMGVTSEEEDEEETHLVWSRKGIRGANALTMVIPDLEETKDVLETRTENEPTESEKKRERKGRGKMVESPTKGDKNIYNKRRGTKTTRRCYGGKRGPNREKSKTKKASSYAY